jgi:uncharacterized protein YkwD
MKGALVAALLASSMAGAEQAERAATDRAPVLSIPLLEQRIHDLINTERIRTQVRPLKMTERLSKIARDHSQDMASRRFFDHVNPDGKNATARAIAGKFPCRKDRLNGSYTLGVSENIFQNNLYSKVMFYQGRTTYQWNSLDEIARTTVKGWMESPGHRANILNRGVETSGVGIAVSSDDQVLITQLFC